MKNFSRLILCLVLSSLLAACKQEPVRFAYLSDNVAAADVIPLADQKAAAMGVKGRIYQ